MRADEVYAILKGKLVKLTEDIKTMGDWKPIQHKGTVQTADDLPTDAKEGWMYNIATDSIYGAAGMNVVMTSEGWDPMGPIINMGLEYNSETNCLEFGSDQKMELNQGIGLDSTLTKTGSAADAGATGKEINSLKGHFS